MAGKPGVMIYFDMLPTMEGLTTTDMGVLFKAIMQYGLIGIPGKLTKRTELLWPMIKSRLDSDTMRYIKTVRRKEYAAYVRWAKRHEEEPKDFVSWMEDKHFYVEGETYYDDWLEELKAKAKEKAALNA